jgi:leader peptidase (prepilin peptidase)/N-methyltransferase
MVIFGIALLGVIFGSFVNALVWRLHEQAELVGKKGKTVERRREELSIVKGRSMCPHCGHTLAAKDLIPVISWLWLRGKCRYCGTKILDSPLVEIASGVLFAISYVAWPNGLHGLGLFELITWLIFIVCFLALGVYDLRWFLLPNRIVFPITGLAIIRTVVISAWSHNLNQLWMPVAGAAVIAGLFWCLYQVSSGRWIGGGDVKLAVTLGLLAGTPLRALMVIFFASLVGTIASIPQLLQGREGLTRRIPFGPALLAATIIIVLWGSPISEWYQGLVLR